jgi:hypothetical protein
MNWGSIQRRSPQLAAPTELPRVRRYLASERTAVRKTRPRTKEKERSHEGREARERQKKARARMRSRTT